MAQISTKKQTPKMPLEMAAFRHPVYKDLFTVEQRACMGVRFDCIFVDFGVQFSSYAWDLFMTLNLFHEQFHTKIVIMCPNTNLKRAKKEYNDFINHFKKPSCRSSHPLCLDHLTMHDASYFHAYVNSVEGPTFKWPFASLCDELEIDPKKALIIDITGKHWLGAHRQMTNFWWAGAVNDLQLVEVCKYLLDTLYDEPVLQSFLQTALTSAKLAYAYESGARKPLQPIEVEKKMCQRAVKSDITVGSQQWSLFQPVVIWTACDVWPKRTDDEPYATCRWCPGEIVSITHSNILRVRYWATRQQWAIKCCKGDEEFLRPMSGKCKVPRRDEWRQGSKVQCLYRNRWHDADVERVWLGPTAFSRRECKIRVLMKMGPSGRARRQYLRHSSRFRPCYEWESFEAMAPGSESTASTVTKASAPVTRWTRASSGKASKTGAADEAEEESKSADGDDITPSASNSGLSATTSSSRI